jgi:nicotinamide riboside kinase
MIHGLRGDVKVIGLFGSESLGKTSIGYMLTGRLRSHGVLAEFVTDSSAAMPFEPECFDHYDAAWMYVVAKKIAAECEFALRRNVEVIISDRTPLDLWYYWRMKHPRSSLLPNAHPLVLSWMHQYDALYFLPAAGTEFRYDQFREPTDDSRRTIDEAFQRDLAALSDRYPALTIAGGTYRERGEFIYHDLLAKLLGLSKPQRVIEQVDTLLRAALTDQYQVSEVRLLGSRSLTRSHTPGEEDDYDLAVVIEGDALQAAAADCIVQQRLAYLEKTVEATLDIKVVTKEMLPHEL